MKTLMSLLVGLAVGATVVLALPQTEDPEPQMFGSPPYTGSAKFITDYSDGLSELYATAASKADAGEFVDIKAANEFIEPRVDEVRDQAFVPMGQMLETINGEGWSNEKAANVFREIAEGFKR